MQAIVRRDKRGGTAPCDTCKLQERIDAGETQLTILRTAATTGLPTSI